MLSFQTGIRCWIVVYFSLARHACALLEKHNGGFYMSTMDTEKAERRHIVDWPWPVIASVVGLLALGLAYTLSDAYYNTFLGRFWVDSRGFPIDKASHLVLSVWGALNAGMVFENWLGQNKMDALKLVLLLLGLVAMSQLIESAGRKVREKRAAAVSNRDRSLLRRALAAFWPMASFSLLVLVGLCTMLILVPVLIAIPSGVGETVAINIAVNLKRDFDLGCERSKKRCQILLKDGREIARGYVIVQSPTRIALYYNGGTRQLPMDGVELRTVDLTSDSSNPSKK
ncbi:hypothetical protein [Burkholderia gladioli]|uniref:hypothetical protein n=1 Tax=Burkholderia gladioli TaxID=28095 RepID=UPI00163EDFD0|nr:hypothetical protein [Burkholderia gladioli]